jgi:putative phage-type endonuclease
VTADFAGAELVGTFEPGSPEWHAARAGLRLGGSEIAAVLNLSPFESPFSLWHRKKGHIGPVVETEQMEWGRRLEPAICEKYQDRHPDVRVVKGGTYRNRQRPWQISNPDRLLYLTGARGDRPSGLFEAKTAFEDEKWGPDGTDEVPVYYRAQGMHYMDCLTRPWIDLGCLISGCQYREYRIHYDADEAAFMRDRAEAFLADLANDVRPPLDGSDATYRAVREMHPDIEPISVEIDPLLADEYRAVCLAAKAAKAEKQSVAVRIADAMGNARTAQCLGERIAIRVPNGDHKPFLRPAPELLKEAVAA